MHISKITALVDKTNAERAVLLCHHNADPDAICSAFAFSRLLKRLYPQLAVEIAAAQGPSRLSKQLLSSLPMRIMAEPHIEAADIIVMLDTNTLQQLDEWSGQVKASKAPIVVIDHHASHPQTESLATVCVAEEETSSTCEIVHRLFKEAGVKLDKIVAMALFLGIASDTRHFILANSDTFKVVADLVEAGVDAKESLALLSLPTSHSERVARLRAGQRVKVKKIGEWLIVFSRLSAYQASAARALIRLGAHVAVVGGKKGETLRISLRADRDFYRATGLHLGRDVAKPLGEYVRGMGGGHSTAAGVNGAGDVSAGFKRCTELIRKRLAENAV